MIYRNKKCPEVTAPGHNREELTTEPLSYFIVACGGTKSKESNLRRREDKMTRAVAIEGTELIEGIHRGSSGESVITIKQANGLIREVPYSAEAIATPVLVEAMIKDMGIESPEIREATEQYCLDYIEGWNKLIDDPESDGVPLRELEGLSNAFIDGYEAVLKRNG
jgi:hypothetical protein